MPGHLEPLAAVLRIGGAYGKPYSWACTVRHFTPTEVELVGAIRAPTLREWRAALKVLAAAGITVVRFNRRKGDTADERRMLTRSRKGESRESGVNR